ncbi:MAG TPA: 50S ribosomal protein L25 [Gaiellaceae bacterium]|nr:50S ribosomal protein L25 [Gaiellaceae bacterium]
MSGDRYTLQVKERGDAERGSAHARRLRRAGFVPGVLYGKGQARAIAIGERDLRDALTTQSGLHAIVDVVIEGQTTPHHAILKEYQQHPVKGTLTHVDFHEIRLDQPIQTAVSVQLVGESVGVRAGGQIQHAMYEVHIEALPTNIPDHLEADVSGLEIGDTLRLEDIPAIDGVTFLDDPQTVVASCVEPRVIEMEEEAPEEAEGEEAEAGGEGGEPSAEAAEQRAGEDAGESAPEE